jgi:GTPase SAR1 family protein
LEVTSSPSTDEYINILLLGDSGVGKSTFINAFANYLLFGSLQQAKSGRPIVIIPVSFLITVNDNFDEQRIKFGEPDPNEQHNEIGQSVTQECRSYVFEISPGKKLRIIDTPGFADTRGDSQDEINMNMIFSFMNNLTHLNAVCLLFRPSITRLNPFLYTYFTQIVQCFGENIRDHLIFCFTNARTTFFAPGDTRPLLKAFFNSFPVKNIPFEKKNTFCFDSESFRYLVALQDGFKFNDMQEDEMKNSWIRSVEESKRLRNFLCKELQPYRRNIQWQSIQNAQYQIISLIRPMLETIRNILRNILLYEMNCSIQLKATYVNRPTIICYNCNRTPKVFHQFGILPDLIHHSPSEVS